MLYDYEVENYLVKSVSRLYGGSNGRGVEMCFQVGMGYDKGVL